MSKTGLILFARVDSAEFKESELTESLQSLKELDTDLDLYFIGFGPAAKNISKFCDNFLVYENLDIKFFQSVIVEKLDFFAKTGYNKTIISSCSHILLKKNFLDKNLVIVSYDENDFNEKKNLNHRFMYGRTALLKRIWENKQFDITKDLDKNLFLNVFNVIGKSKMDENKVEMNGFINRVGWSTQ